MPILVDNKFLFLRVPKTGSGSAQAGLMQAFGARAYVFGRAHMTLAECLELFPRKVYMACVRRPETWLRSVWAAVRLSPSEAGPEARSNTGIDDFPDMVHQIWAGDFTAFVDNYLLQRPGWIAKFFERYVGPPAKRVPVIGHCETLEMDLSRGLRAANVTDFDPTLLHVDRRIHQAGTLPQMARHVAYEPALLADVRRTEAWVYREFYGEQTDGE